MNEPDSSSDSKDRTETEKPAELDDNVPGRIRRLLSGQSYAVLCTQSQSQPYGSLVAFAASDDLAKLVFATLVTTRKYRLLTECEHVALLIDSRSTSPDDMMGIEAVTVTGRAQVAAAGEEFDRCAGLLLSRHSHLAPFVKAESSALVSVEVVRCFHVCRFQEVSQWVPGSGS